MYILKGGIVRPQDHFQEIALETDFRVGGIAIAIAYALSFVLALLVPFKFQINDHPGFASHLAVMSRCLSGVCNRID